MVNTLAAFITLRFKGNQNPESSFADSIVADIESACVAMSMEYELALDDVHAFSDGLVAHVEVWQSESGRPLSASRLESLRDELATDVGCSDSHARLKGGAA
jgi:hypothetical protein